MSFFQRTRHLDKHVAHRIRERASILTKSVQRDRKMFGENFKDLDGPPMRELAKMWQQHADTIVISDWLFKQDTAFRDQVPRVVWDILKENTYD